MLLKEIIHVYCNNHMKRCRGIIQLNFFYLRENLASDWERVKKKKQHTVNLYNTIIIVIIIIIIDEVNFSIYLILPAAPGPGFYPASNRNEYQKHKNDNVSGE
jgi:ABC-type lipoprotein release transport system permease subunit